MTKVTMPEAVAYPTDEWVDEFFGNPDETGFYSFRGDFGNIAYRFQLAAQAGDFITTDQAEAYAAAKVREALERAESQIMKMHDQAVKARVHPDQAEDGWNDSCADRAIALGEAVLAIRALIPPLPGPVEPPTN